MSSQMPLLSTTRTTLLFTWVLMMGYSHCLTKQQAYNSLDFEVWEDPSFDQIEKHYKNRVQEISAAATEEESMAKFNTLRDSYNFIKSQKSKDTPAKSTNPPNRQQKSTSINISITEESFITFLTIVVYLVLFVIAMAIPLVRQVTLIAIVCWFFGFFPGRKAGEENVVGL